MFQHLALGNAVAEEVRSFLSGNMNPQQNVCSDILHSGVAVEPMSFFAVTVVSEKSRNGEADYGAN